MPSREEVANQFAVVARITRTRAHLHPDVYDPDHIGHALVLIENEQGVVTQRSVRVESVITMEGGRSVLVGLDWEEELAILEPDFSGQIDQGANPLDNNAADKNVNGSVNQAQIQTLDCYPGGGTELVVRPWFYVYNDTWYYMLEQRVEVNTLIPAGPDTHCLAMVYVASDNTAKVVASTPIDLKEDLGTVDVQECWDAASDKISPARFWVLHDGMTTVAPQDEWRDARQFVNIVAVSGVGYPLNPPYSDILPTPPAGTGYIYPHYYNSDDRVHLIWQDDESAGTDPGVHDLYPPQAEKTVYTLADPRLWIGISNPPADVAAALEQLAARVKMQRLRNWMDL